jgi:hypothetical protein
MKYARFVDYSQAADGSDVRTVDAVDLAAYQPMPSWYTTDEAFLERIFSPQAVAQWKAAGRWFIAVPQGVQDGACFSGSDHSDPLAYRNPDGTFGDGSPINPPPDEGVTDAVRS